MTHLIAMVLIKAALLLHARISGIYVILKHQRFLLLVGVMTLQACSDRSDPATGDAAGQIQNLLNQLIVDDGTFKAPATPDLPGDLLLHPQSQAEAVSLEAILSIDDTLSSTATSTSTSSASASASGPSAVAGLMAQLERIALTPATEVEDTGSSWQYSSVMRSRVVTDVSRSDDDAIDGMEAATAGLSLLADLPARQSVQRMALDLAGANTNGLWVGADGVQLELTAPLTDSCERTYQWQSTLSSQTQLTLNFTLRNCPELQGVGELNTWQSAGFALSGQLASAALDAEATTTAISGYGWLRQSYGNFPPLAEAAVLLDSLRLRLVDGRLLDITRSKRRSGRGPRTVSARLKESGGAWRDVALDWEDSEEQRVAESGNEYPDSIRITAIDESIDIDVQPMNRLSESTEMSGSQLSVPVTADGSHTGAGFITFFSLSPTRPPEPG